MTGEWVSGVPAPTQSHISPSILEYEDKSSVDLSADENAEEEEEEEERHVEVDALGRGRHRFPAQ